MKGKKSNLLLSSIVDVLIASIILFAFLSVTVKIEDNTIYTQKHAARDIAFTIDAASLAPETLEFKYLTKRDQQINIDQDKCIVKVRSQKKETIPTSFSCSNKDLLINKGGASLTLST